MSTDAIRAMEATATALNGAGDAFGNGGGNEDVQKAGQVIQQIGGGVAMVNPVAGAVVGLIGTVVGFASQVSG